MFSGLENPTHWLVLAAVVLIVMGPKRLPEIGRSLGTSFRGFKDSLEGHDAPAPREVERSEVAADTAPRGPQAPQA